MESIQSKEDLQKQIKKMQISSASRKVKKMTQFIEWWHTKVNGPFLTNEQFTNIYNKF